MTRPSTPRLLAAAGLILFTTSLQLVLSDVDKSWVPAGVWGAAVGALGCAILLRRSHPIAWALAIGGGLACLITSSVDDSTTSGEGFLGYASELGALIATGCVLIAAAIAWHDRDA